MRTTIVIRTISSACLGLMLVSLPGCRSTAQTQQTHTPWSSGSSAQGTQYHNANSEPLPPDVNEEWTPHEELDETTIPQQLVPADVIPPLPGMSPETPPPAPAADLRETDVDRLETLRQYMQVEQKEASFRPGWSKPQLTPAPLKTKSALAYRPVSAPTLSDRFAIPPSPTAEPTYSAAPAMLPASAMEQAQPLPRITPGPVNSVSIDHISQWTGSQQ